MSKRYLQWGYESFKDNKTGEICDNYIDLLNQQAERIVELEDKWEDLKQFIEKDHDWNLERGNNDCALGQRWVLDKIEELEQGEDNAKN